jgi:hypothetical protein
MMKFFFFTERISWEIKDAGGGGFLFRAKREIEGLGEKLVGKLLVMQLRHVLIFDVLDGLFLLALA